MKPLQDLMERLANPQNVLLPSELVQAAWPHPVGEGRTILRFPEKRKLIDIHGEILPHFRDDRGFFFSAMMGG
jgi:hypothetical protein